MTRPKFGVDYRAYPHEPRTLKEQEGLINKLILDERNKYKAALEALVAGVEDAVLRFLDSHDVSLRSDMDSLLRARMARARAALGADKGTP